MLFTTHDGAKVGYRVDGKGPTVVLVHGTGGDGVANWHDVTNRLSDSYTVIRPDYAGSGRTEDLSDTLSVELLAGQVLSAVDAADVDTFVLVGFSLGSAVAIQIAAMHPDRVSKLVLISGFVKADPRLRLEFELWRRLIRTDKEAMAKLVLLSGFSPDELTTWGDKAIGLAVKDIVQTQPWEGMLRQVELDLALDVSDMPAKVQMPTLVLGATHDQMVPPSHAKALAEAIGGARYVELPTGHLSPMENPDMVARQITAFIQEVDP